MISFFQRTAVLLGAPFRVRRSRFQCRVLVERCEPRLLMDDAMWTGGGDPTDFFDKKNWADEQLPDATHVAVLSAINLNGAIKLTNPNPVTIAGIVVEGPITLDLNLKQLTLSGPLEINGGNELTINDGGGGNAPLTLSEIDVATDANSTGTLNIQGWNTKVSVGIIKVGTGAGSAGFLSISNEAEVSAGMPQAISEFGFSGTAHVSIDNATIHTSGLLVFNGGTGAAANNGNLEPTTLSVANGGLLVDRSTRGLNLGDDARGPIEVSAEGENSKISAFSTFIHGASVYIHDEADFEPGDLTLNNDTWISIYGDGLMHSASTTIDPTANAQTIGISVSHA